MSDPRPVPTTMRDLTKRLNAFKSWLVSNGSAVLAPTNEWEVLRFQGDGQIGVIYSNGVGRLSYVNGADEVLFAHINNQPWRAIPKTQANKWSKRRAAMVASVAQRDGWGCSFCRADLTVETATIEHFVALTSGGPDALANMMLACRPCNTRAGYMSVREKLEFAIARRAA